MSDLLRCNLKVYIAQTSLKTPASLFKALLDEISWEAVLGDKGVEENEYSSRMLFLAAQELSLPQNKKVGREGRKSARLGKDLLVKRKGKEETISAVESQNHRISGIGRDLERSSSPIPLLEQEHLDQVTQECVQVGFECLQRRRLHNLSEKPVPVFC